MADWQTPDELRVARPLQAQPATFNQKGATKSDEGATGNATDSLKALAGAVLRRNTQRNQGATDPEKKRNFYPSKTPVEVAPVCGPDSGVAALVEAREERSAIMEYEGGLPRQEAEARAQQIKHVRCLDCGFDTPEGPKCNAGMGRTRRDLKIRICAYYSEAPEPLAPEDEAAIRAWLAHINETKDYEIAKVLAKCQGNADALAYFLGRAEEVRRA